MGREKRRSIDLGLLGAVLFTALLTACGTKSEDITIFHIDFQDEIKESTSADNNSIETEAREDTRSNIDATSNNKGQELTSESIDSMEKLSEEDTLSQSDSQDEIQEPTLGENGSMEIYSGREIISLSDDMIVGQVAIKDILQGKPVLYDRFITDGFVFEWIISDYEDDDNIFLEDGVLIISKEDDSENTRVIHVQAEGYGGPVSLENKFEYMDVNFDDVPDLLICTGHHGNQGLITYYCFLQTDTGFVEAPTFTEIPNPAVDAENKLILSQWRNWAASHSWAEYKYQDNAYVLNRELCEEAVGYDEDGNDIWVWTVNGEEIGRSDELSESEKADLVYNENSEWRILDDRWRTIFNNGLTADGSIYNEP